MRRKIKRLLHEAGVEKGKEGGQGKSGGGVNGEKEGIVHLHVAKPPSKRYQPIKANSFGPALLTISIGYNAPNI
jgi:hypothetical protein